MCTPSTDYKPPISGIVHEAMGAMSSLNMIPEPIENPTGEYLADTDAWAKHSMEHMRAVLQLASQAGQRTEQMLRLLDFILDIKFGIEMPSQPEDAEQWALDTLAQIVKQLRAERRHADYSI